MVARNSVKGEDVGAKADDVPQVVSLRSREESSEDERVPLFEIDGVEYAVTTNPKVNLSLRYLHLARTQGSDVAIGFMLETLLGVEGYEALMNFDDLTQEQLEQVITAASKIMTGPAENPKGKRSRG